MTIFVNGKKVESFNFSGGECHVRISPKDITNNTRILAKLHNSNAIMRLLMTVDAIRQINHNTHIDLTIPYFPYARQDRVCSEGEAFGVKVMADLINNLECQSVTVYDPHSQVTVDALNNCHVISLCDIVCSSMLIDKIKADRLTIISPDKGATDKVQQVGKQLNADVLCAHKIRNPGTGEITATEFYGDVVGKDCIILDDICDGGRTFTELACILKQSGANKIYLYVTHGIFSKGLIVFKKHFNHLYCYQTMLDGKHYDHDLLTTFEA